MGIGKRITTGEEYQESSPNNEPEQDKKKRDENIYLPEEPKFSLGDIVLPVALKEKILDVAEYAQNS